MADTWAVALQGLVLALVLAGLVHLESCRQRWEGRIAELEQEVLRLRSAGGSSGGGGLGAAAVPEAARLLYAPSAPLDFAIVSDLDKASRDKRKLSWKAHVRQGRLHYEPPSASVGPEGRWRLEWTPGTRLLESGIAVKNRSMELSELVRFNGRLYAFCDSTGVMFEVDLAKSKAYQRTNLADGDGYNTKPFKAEWATVKDGELLVGSMGREWVADDGSIEHFNPQWVKGIDGHGRVRSYNWRHIYQALRTVTNTTLPGYLWHEAVEWDARGRRWLVLPRKASEQEPYTPESDETRGTNLLLVASEDFSLVQVHQLGPLEPEWGFTALRRVPGSEGIFLALKALEVGDRTETRIALFSLGIGSEPPRMLLDPPFQALGGAAESSVKYEGLEFLHDG